MGDFNAVSAAVRFRHGQWRFYDEEPYTLQSHDDLEYQVQPGTVGAEQLADRRQTQVLLRRDYMVDSAALLEVPWEPTTGHWEDGRGDPDPWGPRRIDLALVTRPVAPAVVSYRVFRSDAAAASSDHAPVIIEIDPARISEG